MDAINLTVQPYLEQRFAEIGRKLRFHSDSKDDVHAWQKAARETLAELIGLPTMKRCDADAASTETIDCGDYTRERIELSVEPMLRMPVYVLKPKTGKKSYPVVIAPHGHGGGGKAAVAGVADDPKVADAITSYNYAYGVEFCRAGCIVFCPDARGFGERQEQMYKKDILASSCEWLNRMAMPLGQTVTGMWVWDLMRLIDYVETRSDCDGGRIGCGGLSGGGLQTLWLAALDERIKAAVVSGYFYGVKESLLDLFNCSCNYVPHLWEYADHGDLGALIAPRPLMIQTGDQDNLNGAGGMENVYPQATIARAAYAALGAEANLHHDIFHGPHCWNSANSVPFLVNAISALPPR